MKKLIVSRYNENIDWVNKINFDYIIYNKGINDLYQPHINLKNVGREADTYLNYIILNYHKLPEIVVFSQGNPFDHCYDFIEKVNKTTDINNVTWLGSNWGPITKNYDGGPGSDPIAVAGRVFGRNSGLVGGCSTHWESMGSGDFNLDDISFFAGS